MHAEYGRLLKRFAGATDVARLREAAAALQIAKEQGMNHRGVFSSLIGTLLAALVYTAEL